MPKEMSWLSPRRRRTTGNLRNVPNAQLGSQIPVLPPTTANASANNVSPKIPLRSASTLAATLSSSAKKKAPAARPSSAHRPQSQPTIAPVRQRTDSGNLFYAYARKSTDAHSRYLLTFASATVAREWWLLVQAHFPRTTRPAPQLFSFVDEEMIGGAWRHSAFEHLKSKWMYIALPPAADNSDRGGVIPLQDDLGNLLGGSAPSSPEPRRDGERGSLTSIRDEDEALSTQNRNGSLHDHSPMANNVSATSSDVDVLKTALDGPGFEPNGGQATIDGLDMSRVLVHLDGIQAAIHQLNASRAQHHERPAPLVDLSPLADTISEMQQTLETTMKFVKDLVERQEQSVQEQKTSFDPLKTVLERVVGAIEAGNAQTLAIADHARSDEFMAPVVESLGALQESTQGLARHIDAAFGTTGQDADRFGLLGTKLDQVNEHLQVLREWTEFDSEHLQELLGVQKAARESTSLNSTASTAAFDFSPITEHLDRIHSSLTQQHVQLPSPDSASGRKTISPPPGTGDAKFLMSALSSHLSKIQAVTDHNAQHIKSLREHHTASAQQTHEVLEAMRAATRLQSQAPPKAASVPVPPPESDPRYQRLERGLEATNAQVRELMSGQRELVDVMRQLAESITASNKSQCDHIVVPPPRKMGRKVVGFVYDTKDGPV